jgi:hypothetical protein
MYNGNPVKPLQCVITGEPAFIEFKDIVTKKNKLRFRLDFNHIRQKSNDLRTAGASLDKSDKPPSGYFRDIRLDRGDMPARLALLEFMTIMPISAEVHHYISQDSQKGDITLENFDKKFWPWVLKSEKNYNKFCGDYNLDGIGYENFIEHLSNIDNHPLHKRVYFLPSTGEVRMV